MSIGSILESLQQSLAGGPERFLAFRADGDLASTLTLGRIIKGKVMRHYEQGRYGIEFNGREKVVDATFPLQKGEVIYARVIGIDEKIHLQRVVGEGDQRTEPDPVKQAPAKQSGAEAYRDSISALFDKYQAKLSSEEHQLIRRLQNTLGGSRRVAVSALILSKLGVALDPGLIKAIHRVLTDSAADARLFSNMGPAHSFCDVSGDPQDEMIEGLAALLGRISEKGPAPSSSESEQVFTGDPILSQPALNNFPAETDFGQGGGRDQLEWFLGQWLLNAQTEGAVAHRFIRIPLWFAGQMVEVTLALFAQKEPAEDRHNGSNENEVLRYRKAVFALQTDNLGHLQIQAKMADHHVRIEVVADSIATAEYLGSQMVLLKTALSVHGWQLDDICYGTRTEPDGPLQAVIEHYIAQDSLNRLL